MTGVFLCVVLIISMYPQSQCPYFEGPRIGQFTPTVSAENDYLSVNGYVFDPHVNLPELPVGLTGPTGYYLVQIRGPVYNHMKDLIGSCGAEICEYIPHNAFIVKMGENSISLVRALPFVRWIGNYEPAYKVSPLFDEIRDEDRMVLVLFNNADVDVVLDELNRIGCETIDIALSEWNKILLIRTGRDNIARMCAISDIMFIEPWMETVALNASAQWVTQTWKQNNRRIWDKGLDGTGQVVNTSDTGILTTHDLFRDPAVSIVTWGNYPTHRKIIAYQYPTGSAAAFGDNANGVWHGTHTAGTICGDDSYVSGASPNDGMPPKAKMYFQDIGTSTGGLSVPSNYDNIWLPPFNGNAGGAARISSNSWGQSGSSNTYTSTARMVDIFMWNHKEFLICFSAGNSGPAAGTVKPPSTAKDCISAGMTYNSTAATVVSELSSRGPCIDGRIKPTVTAPGHFLYSSVGAANNAYLGMAGTSMASPCTGGSAALVRDYFASGFYPTGVEVPGNAWSYISAAMVKAVIVNGASPDMTGLTIPDNNTGWGRVCLDDALYFANDTRRLTVYDDTTGLSTGQYAEYVVSVNNQSEPIKITLVWTDYYGAANANPALVNDLNLQVTGPNMVQYRGNQYSGGQSIPNPGVWDNRNVEENVRRNVPETGNWTIRVNALNVPLGTRQPYALVVSGGLGPVSEPVLHIVGSQIEDPAPGGNYNQRIEPGETVYLTDTLKNLSAAGVTNCVGTLRESSPFITLLDSVGNFGNIPVGASAHNGASRFRFSALGSTPPGTMIPFTLHLTGGGGYVQDIDFELQVGMGGLVIIWGPNQVELAPTDTHFLYGLAYNPVNDRIYVTNYYERKIYMYTSDSSVTYLGYITAPDTMATDIKYCAYDNTFWVAARPSAGGRRVFKINTSGTVLRQFNNPANDYPVGLAWLEPQRLLYLSDRRTNLNTFPQYIYRSDTLGNATQMNLPLQGNVGARCLASEPYGPDTTLLHTYTWFNTAGTQLDSVALYELNRSNLAVLQGVQFPGWNVRGIEYDPRDGNYWVTIAQNPNRSIAKILGFHGVPIGVSENRPGALPVDLALAPSYPNPFKDRVHIVYTLPKRMSVRLVLYDVAGRLVKTFVDGVEEPGTKVIEWNGLDDGGTAVSSGVYFYRLETEYGTSLVRKLVHTR